MKIFLCSINEMLNHSSREFIISENNLELELFIVCKQNQAYAYFNQCPHTGVNLNWQPNQFLDIDNSFIQCATHGALFRIEDGYCFRGPCAGMSLKKLTLELENGAVYVSLPSMVKSNYFCP